MKTGAVGWGKISAKFLSDTGLPSEIYGKLFSMTRKTTNLNIKQRLGDQN